MILFTSIVKTANYKIALSSGDPPLPTQIIFFDQAGYQTKIPANSDSISFSSTIPLVSALSQNSLDKFCINFSIGVIHSYIFCNVFEDAVGYNIYLGF